MVFDPKVGTLACPYCGTTQEIERHPEKVTERDFSEFLRPAEDRLRPMAKEAMQVSCDSCGATVTFIPPETATICEFCGAKIVAQPKAADPLVAPEGIIPFSVPNKTAASAVSDWTRTRWFAPNKLKTMAQQGRVSSVYIPYWTFDSDTETRYTGEQGEDYTVSTGPGNPRVKKTKWYPASGIVSRHFDDVPVPASTSVLPHYVSSMRWDFSELTSYDPAFLSGHRAQTYQVPLEAGFEAFKNFIEPVIRRDVLSDIGGDSQRIHSMDTGYSNVTFKHILAPVYAGAYRFNNKVYQVIVNGRTGEVYGERPYSTLKIGCLVIVIFFLVVLIVLISSFSS